MDVKMCFLFGWVERLPASWEALLGRRVPACVVASIGLGVRGWMFKFSFFSGRVVRLPASREARLGRRVSACVVASKVWGCVGGC